MGSLNKVLLIGNLGKDPEMQYTQSGMAITHFSLATSETIVDKSTGEKREDTTWHNITIFGKMAETLTQYLSKGKQIYVEGRIRNSSYDDKDGIKRYKTEVIANNIVLLGKRDDTQSGQDEYQEKPAPQAKRQVPIAGQRPQSGQAGQVRQENIPAGYQDDDDIPF